MVEDSAAEVEVAVVGISVERAAHSEDAVAKVREVAAERAAVAAENGPRRAACDAVRPIVTWYV